jgi:hypothetical protein
MASQAKAHRLCWVLELQGDTRYRWTSRDVVAQLRGVTVEARSGLVVEDVDEYLDSDEDGTVVGVPIRGIADIAALVRVIGRATVDLAICPVDAAGVAELGNRLSVAGGLVADMEVDPDGAVATLQLRSLVAQDRAQLAPASWGVEDLTWPKAPDDARGMRVPLVYGAPGSYAYSSVSDGAATPVYDYEDALWRRLIEPNDLRVVRLAGATPAVPVERETISRYALPWDSTTPLLVYYGDVQWLAVAQGHAPAATVEVWARRPANGASLGGWNAITLSTVKGYDGLGRACTLVDLSGLGEAYRTAGAWMVAWSDGGALGDQLPGLEYGALGAVTTWMLRRSTLPIDWQGVHAVAQRLDHFRVGGYVDEDLDPVSWCRERLGLHGARVRWSRRGLSLVLADQPDPLPVGRLEVGGAATLDGPIRYTAASADVVVVTWAQADTTAGRSARSRVEAVEPEADGAEITVSLPECWDAATAIGVGQMELQRRGPQVEVAVQVEASEWWWVRPGDVLDLAHAAMGWVAGPASRWRVTAATHTTGSLRRLQLRRISTRRSRARATVSSSTERASA